MKKSKQALIKSISMFLAVLLCIGNIIIAMPEDGIGSLFMTAYAATSGTCGDNLTWVLDDEGTLTISGTGAMTDWNGSTQVPWNNSSIKNMVIGEGVTRIDDYAYNVCHKLENIIVNPNNSVYSSYNGALFNKSMTDLIRCPEGKNGIFIIPYGVTLIDVSAFQGCQITSVDIPESVMRIESSAFSYSDIANVIIPNSVTYIGNYAFRFCYSLVSVEIGDGVEEIGSYYTFEDCSNLESIIFGNSLTTIGSSIMFEGCSKLNTLYIPYSVTNIASGAFSSCKNIANVYYEGSEADWKYRRIVIGSNNDYLLYATIHYGRIEEPSLIWDGTIAANFARGTGTASDPYIIETADQLAHLAQDTTTDYKWKYVSLANDIYLNDISDFDTWNTSPPDHIWIPVINTFSGTFLGNNHTIYGMYCTDDNYRNGLFSNCSAAIVENLNIADAYIIGGAYTGGIIGSADGCFGSYGGNTGTVNNCTFDGKLITTSKSERVGGIIGYVYGGGSVNAGTSNGMYITNCTSYADIDATNSSSGCDVGGIIGYGVNRYSRAPTCLEYCYNYGRLIGSDGSYIGGIVGNMVDSNRGGSSIEHCANYGDITKGLYAGGIIGRAATSTYQGRETYIDQCYNLGDIVTTAGESYAGGIAGQLYTQDNDCSETISNSFNLGSIESPSYAGGIVGSRSYTTYNYLKYCYNAGQISESKNAGGIAGYSYQSSNTKCYYLDSSCSTTSKVGTALSASGMKTPSSFVDYDFDTVWVQNDYINNGYPYLRFSQEGLPITEGIDENLSDDKTFTGEEDAAMQTTKFPQEYSKYPYEYSDMYFGGSAYDYNHDLATMSLCLAMAGYNSHNETDNLSHKADNVIDLLGKCGYNKIKAYNYDKPTDTDTIAVCFGQREIGNDVVLAIVVRGGNYGAEWGGDFRMGDENYFIDHEGFKIAKDYVMDYFSQYLKEFYINSENYNKSLKLWITGYSRGAATANLVAATLDENSIHAGDVYIPLDPDQIFTYTFETPLNTTDNKIKDSVYLNIFNIVNPADLVTKVAPAKWGFGRYGVDVCLPAAGITSDYAELEAAMHVEYVEMIESATEFPFIVEIDDRNPAEVLDRIMDGLVTDALESRSNYYENYENSIIQAAKAFLGGSLSTEDQENMLSELKSVGIDFVIDTVKNIGMALLQQDDLDIKDLTQHYDNAKEVIRKYIPNISDEELDKLVGVVFELLVDAIILDFDQGMTMQSLKVNEEDVNIFLVMDLSLDAMINMFQTHQPTVCLSWMRSLRSNTEWFNRVNTGTYRIGYINCPVDVEVFDESNVCVASIIDNAAQAVDNSGVSAYIDSNGQKVICLPYDMEYQVKITATDDGEMTYTVTEYNTYSGNEKVVSYYDVDLTDGAVYYGEIENLTAVDDAEYKLLTGDGTAIAPDADVVGDEIVEYSVTTSAEGDGSTIGGGSAIAGEHMQLIAVHDDNIAFYGWYIDDELVSTDESYRFRVERDVEIVAKFEVETDSVTLSAESMIICPEESTSLTATVSPSDATADVVWSTSDSRIATVDQNGTVTAHALGTVTITATAGDASASCTIEVIPPICLTAMGGSVRIVEPYGLRFGIQLKKDEAYNQYKDIIVSYGTLIIPKKNLGDTSLTFDVEKAMDVPAVNIYSEDSTQLTYTGVLVGIPKSAFYSDIVGRGYLKYLDIDGNEKVLYTDEIVRSYYQVANSAYTRYGNMTDRDATEQAVYEKLAALLAEMTA